MEKVERNMQKLEDAVKVIRGVEVQVRPHAKKSGWYGEELARPPPYKLKDSHIELDVIRPDS